MTRRPIFWAAFTALGLASLVAGVLLFSSAFPSISVDIRMSRAEAIDSALVLSTRYAWGEPQDRSAATFGLADDLVQTYVELEGGGVEAFQRLSARDVYEPYQWRVRRFAEGRVQESVVRFTPEGAPYGFQIQFAEDDPGQGNLSVDDARSVAEATATEWGVDLRSYSLAESSQETQPSGRVDHSFVYERRDERLADARFRLRIGVAGSTASELTHFVQVPDAFSRRFAQMRSTNDTIALVAQAILLLVFVLIGAGGGSALLLRARWLEWRKPLAWGALISTFYGASVVNQLPLSWTGYDTALSATSFVLQQVAGGVAIALLGTPLIAFLLLAGESLGRRAFPQHVQQWRFWAPGVASSSTALGMTVAAYLLVGLQLGYVVLFYLGTQRLEGWWSPAEALVQPDLLATYQPWLEAVSLALLASFWEESIFRAVPIACAALLGARFGRRKLWVWGAVLVQAVVFAAAHANYPQQPPYARVIELSFPALLWGAVYVRFGLVPTIMAHFLYDLSLISTVLFESDARLDQLVIVVVGLVPLGLVLGSRLRYGARSAPPEWAFNRAWSPRRVGPGEEGEAVASAVPAAAPPAAAPRPPATKEKGVSLPAWSAPVALASGAVAVVLAMALREPGPSLWGDEDSAVAAATGALQSQGVDVDRWSVSVATSSGATDGRAYVFDEARPQSYEELNGTYFGAPRWVVRLVNWDADPAERAEEYRVWVAAGGQVSRVTHVLPEGRAGDALDVASARALALRAVEERFALDVSDLVEVEAEETSLPARTDWLFTFTDRSRLTEVEGEARIQVRIAGNEVVDVAPTIHVPEEWDRTRRRIRSRVTILAGGLALLVLVGFGIAAVTGVVLWSRHRLPTRMLWRLTALAFVGLLLSSANNWPLSVAGFTTSQPWGVQAGATAIGLVLLACIAAPAIGLVGALAHAWLESAPREGRPMRRAVAYGVLLGGVSLLLPVLLPRPETPDYSGAATLVPLLSAATSVVPVFLILTSAVLVVVALPVRFRDNPLVLPIIWSFVMAASVAIMPVELQASLPLWALGALVLAAFSMASLHVCSRHPAMVPGMVGTALAARALWQTWSGAYAGARVGGVIAAAVACGLAWAWTREAAQSAEETLASVGSE
jgi:membrane protease YdiL (CAAX protease family)